MLRYVLVVGILVVTLAPSASARDAVDEAWDIFVDTTSPAYRDANAAAEAGYATLDGSFYPSQHEPEPSRESAPQRDEPPTREPSRTLLPLVALPLVDLAPVEHLVAASLDSLPLSSQQDTPTSNDATVSDAPLARVYVGHDAPAVAAAAPSASLVTVAAVTAAAPVAASGFTWERLRRFAFAAALYTRIAKERLLDHTAREKLLDAIRAHPGAPVKDLSEFAAIPRNTTVYHLHRLEREGLVSSTKNGRMRLYFAPGALDQRERAPAIAVLRNPVTQRVAAEVGATPGLDQRALCERMGLAPSLAHWHAARLVEAGVMTRERDGRHVRYYPVDV